jgi:hypothetical protein
MIFENNQNKIKVFFAEVSIEMKKVKQILISIMESAGMIVFDYKRDENIENVFEKSDCSIHIIGNIYFSDTDIQLQLAREYSQKSENFKIFIWQPIDRLNISIDERQEKLINKVRNNIFRNMVYAKHESPVMLVEDIRSMMFSEINLNYNVKKTDIFLIYNEIDEDSITNISDLLDDIGSLQLMNIVLNSNIDYSELAAQQIDNAKLSIVFFKRSAKWALPFTQQIWKKIGGASSKSKILLLGDSSHEQNTTINFKAPNVDFLAVAEELIPLEIKVQYDKVTQG